MTSVLTVGSVLRGVKIGKNVWISQYMYIDDWNTETVTTGDSRSVGLRASVFAHFRWCF